MTRFLINSAVLPNAGAYTLRDLTIEEARAWLRADKFISRIGYPATQSYIARVLGVNVTLSRDAWLMRVGDEALVVRLNRRLEDVGQKADRQFQREITDDDFEVQLLTKVGDGTVVPLLR